MCRIRPRGTGVSAGENQSSFDSPENEDSGQHPSFSTPEQVLCVRFIARQIGDAADLTDFESDQEITEASLNPAVDNDDAAAGDKSPSQQVDWIIVTSHANSSIRLHNVQVSCSPIIYLFITVITSLFYY